MKHFTSLLLLGLLCWTNVYATALTHSYDAGKTAAENGTALQAAINAASSGDELKVQAGTYIGNFTMKDGVDVSGGWNSTFDAQTDYATVLDANASGRVVNQAAAFSTLTIWSNLTIQNGKFTTQQTDKAGSGVFLCDKGQVKHCLIQNNLFDAASGEASGGGVYENGYTTSVLIDDCIIRGNTASHGGGVRICGVIQNSIIENNTTTINACGGVQLHYGGAMYNCIVRNNTGKDTGGVRLTGTKACTVANCLIVGNNASGTIGGMSLENGIHYVYNNTIVGNKQTSSTNATRCGVRLNVNANLVFANNIVWGNKANNSVQADQMEIHATYASDRAATYFLNNAVVHASVGTNTTVLTTTDPGFTDAANGDYTLLETSDLVDAGDNTYAQGLNDLADNARISGDNVDMGCYEYQYPILIDNYVHSDEDLQEAIDANPAGTTVYVQAGTYYGNFTMKDGVNVSGGWNADFTEQTDYATILDAQENGRVVNQPANFSNLTIWENLTIQHGKLTANLDTYGAGVFLCRKGQVKHCIIQDNTFTYTGANCMGGGVANNDVAANTDVLVDDCIIRRNTATHGGGVRIKGTIQNSIIESNSTTNNAGAGAHIHTGRMVSCIVRSNTSGGDVGGVRLYGRSQLINCLIANNTATGSVGGVGIESANSDVIGNTIVNNNQLGGSATVTKCGLSCGATSDNGTKLANNIIWGNKHNGVAQIGQVYYISHYNTANRSHNAIAHQNTTNGIKLSMSNDEDDEYIDSDENPQTGLAPHFADPANGDYRLTWQSPMFNKGNNALTTVTEDLDGDTRTKGSVVDYGCYEFDAVTVYISNSHAILTIRGQVCEESSIAMPKGYSGTTNVVAEDGYTLTSVTLNGASVVIDNEGNFSVPAMNTDASIAITAKELTYYNRSVTEGRFGTICLPYGVPSGAIAGAQVYKVISFATEENAGLLLEEVNTMAAGKPYFFMANADEVTFAYIAEGDAATAGNENGLYGTIAGETVSGEGYYVLQNNLLCPTYNAATGEDVEVTLAGNRAYLKFSEVPEFANPAPAPGRRVLGILHAENTATAISSIQSETGAQKVLRDGQLLIIRDGKTYNMLGL